MRPDLADRVALTTTERKTKVERANLALIADARQAIGARTHAIGEQAEQLKTVHGDFVGRMAEQLDSFAQRQQAVRPRFSMLKCVPFSTLTY